MPEPRCEEKRSARRLPGQPITCWCAVLRRFQLCRLCFQSSDLFFQGFYFAWLVVLLLRARQLLLEALQLLVDDVEAFFGFGVHGGEW